MMPMVSVHVPAPAAEEPTGIRGFARRIKNSLTNIYQAIKDSLISCFACICWWQEEETTDLEFGHLDFLDSIFTSEPDEIMNAYLGRGNVNLGYQGFYGEEQVVPRPTTSDVNVNVKDEKTSKAAKKAAKEAEKAAKQAKKEAKEAEKAAEEADKAAKDAEIAAEKAFIKSYKEYLKYEQTRREWSASEVEFMEDRIPSCSWPHAYHVQLTSFRPVYNDLNVVVHTEDAVEHL